MTIASNFSASGLASNMDWSSMIDSLVKLESRPLDLLRERQEALRTQVSTLGTLVSKLSSLKTATADLAGSGVVGVKALGSQTAITAEPSTGAPPGRFTVEVDALAKAAKSRSVSFSATDSLAAGTLNLKVMGKDYSVTMAEGQSLADVAGAIRATGAPISATVLNDGANQILVLTNSDTGFPLGTSAAEALTITETSSGYGKSLGFTALQDAGNALLSVDGIPLTRTSNVITDAVPGTTLTLKAEGGAAEELVLEIDATATAANLQKFVDAYNGVIKLVQSQLAVTETTDRQNTLAGDSAVRSLQGSLQRLLIAKVGTGNVRALADIGIKTARDGSISLDTTTLSRALSKGPAEVNALFTDAAAGLGKLSSKLVGDYT
ncbi:MAG: flagellar filament capping protein FliD, partial [Deltaproteobacteria bacterium]|nr:flagellar filament capping protein FliD [Deltaproteobacteria bacterium]